MSHKDIQDKTALRPGAHGAEEEQGEGLVLLQTRYHVEPSNLAPGLA